MLFTDFFDKPKGQFCWRAELHLWDKCGLNFEGRSISKVQPTLWALERWHFQKSVSFPVSYTYIHNFPSVAMTFSCLCLFAFPPHMTARTEIRITLRKKLDFVVIYLIIYLFIFLSVAVNNSFNKTVAYILSDVKEKQCLQSEEEHLCCEHIFTLHCYRQEEDTEESKFNGLNQIYWIKFKLVSLA